MLCLLTYDAIGIEIISLLLGSSNSNQFACKTVVQQFFQFRVQFRLYLYRALSKLEYRFRARAIMFTFW